MAELADERCVPCRGGVPPLDGQQIGVLLPRVEGWEVDNAARLRRVYRFPDWKEAIRFVNAVGDIAEGEGHHPDLCLRWGEVAATLWTHAINGLTVSDFVLAAKMNRAYSGANVAAPQ
jgi:4a-hydroxytetrahydrobiopterin dehydratase